MEDIYKTVISQYSNSPSLTRLIENIDEWIDPTIDFELFIRLVWDLRTAEGIGLDIWGRIVDVSRILPVLTPGDNFGYFSEGVTDFQPFGQAPFLRGGTLTRNYELTDPAYRQLIYTKAAFNLAATSSQAINAILNILFAGRGRVYVNDYGDMRMRYTFEFYLTPVESAIFRSSGVIPRSSGVLLSAIQSPPGTAFGFYTAAPHDFLPFGQAPFFSGDGSFTAIEFIFGGFAELGEFELGSNEI